MKICIDTDKKKMILEEKGEKKHIDLYSKEAFEILSHQWVKVGWNEKYVYTFSWLGRPIIQLPEDMIRIQEIIYKIKPDVIVETGVAHGGSLIYYASLCNCIGNGKVIGIDIEIRSQNRKAIEKHELYPLITLIEGNSIDNDVFQKVNQYIKAEDKVMVILDSCHRKKHVYEELEIYSNLVSRDSYIVVEDGIMEILYDVPRGKSIWKEDNPSQAVLEFVEKYKDFRMETPMWMFNESKLDKNITHWNNAYIKKIN